MSALPATPAGVITVQVIAVLAAVVQPEALPITGLQAEVPQVDTPDRVVQDQEVIIPHPEEAAHLTKEALHREAVVHHIKGAGAVPEAGQAVRPAGLVVVMDAPVQAAEEVVAIQGAALQGPARDQGVHQAEAEGGINIPPQRGKISRLNSSLHNSGNI